MVIVSHAHIFWLILGILFIIIDLLILRRSGFLYFGLGAILLGLLMTFRYIDDVNAISQVLYFIFLSLVWKGVFFKSRKKRARIAAAQIIGSEAEVAERSGIVPGRIGNVKWNGVIRRARISPDSSIEKVDFGETVYVQEEQDGVFLIDSSKP